MSDTQLLPVVWTLASMVIFVLVTLAVSPARAAQLRLTPGGRFIESVARLLYYVGLPYLTLLTNSLAPIDLGLAGNSGPLLGWSTPDWLAALNDWLVVGLIALIPIGGVARQLAHHARPLGIDVRPTSSIIVDSVYSEIHWAFYRAAPLILLGDVYVATLAGAGLILVEQAVTLAHRGLSAEPEERQSWLGQALLLTMSATLFALTRNLWLIVALHLITELLLKAWSSRLLSPAIESTVERPSRESVESIDQPLA